MPWKCPLLLLLLSALMEGGGGAGMGGGGGGAVMGRREGGRGNEVGLQCMRFVLSYPETAVKHRRTLLPARPVNGG